MKRKFHLLILLISFAGLIKAQNLIAVQHGSITTFETILDSAFKHAQAGDKIFIPGGIWATNGIIINKPLHIIGVGHHPDSTIGGEITYLFGVINLTTGSSNGSISGVKLNGIDCAIYMDTISNYSIKRCRIVGQLRFPCNASFWTLSENIFEGTVFGQECGTIINHNIAFYNNIFVGTLFRYFSNCTIQNNIFLDDAFGGAISVSTFKNNVCYAASNYTSNMSYSIISNNSFVQNITIPFSSNLGANNIVNQNYSSIFIYGFQYFNYNHDYQLKLTCPGKNAGTDGMDIGIFGGVYPWKMGNIPTNPHIQFKKISGTTDSNGNLPIQIKIKAQDK